MLRPCLRHLCHVKLFNAGGASLASMPSAAPSEEIASLGRLIQPFVPLTFTALTQISRTVDGDLMEKVAEAGGLRALLVGYPELFNVSKVGSVYVARRLRKGIDGNKSFSKNNGGRKKKEQEVGNSGSPVRSCPVKRSPPLEVFSLFPTFFVPVDALVTYLRATHMTASDEERPSSRRISISDESTSPEDIVQKKIRQYEEFIEVVSLNGASCRGDSDDNSSGGAIVQHCFVRLQPSLMEFANRFEEVFAKEEDGTCSGELHINHAMELHEVPQYEQYRAARLINVVEEFVPISPEMQQEALVLLAEGRSLIHVFVSAPHLFELRDKPELSVRFLLDPRYRPAITCTKDEILQKLEQLKDGRLKNGLRMPIDRRKKRMLYRQLQFLTNPNPYFDEAVLAHAIVDALPLDGPVDMGSLLPKLPKECVHCMPPDLKRFLMQYPHLFRLLDGERGAVMQRADIPVPEQRDILSIQSDEILLLVYNAFPRRRHPNCGTCLCRCLHNLPLGVRRRLRQLDFVEDVLRKHPERVELLGVDEELQRTCGAQGTLQMFHVFRFVGDLQEDLVKRYETLCAKLGVDPDTTTHLC